MSTAGAPSDNTTVAAILGDLEADMLALAAVTCPACGIKGILTLNHGPEGSGDDAEGMVGLRDERTDGGLSTTE